MATKIVYWRIYCNTEDCWTYGYLDDIQGTPSTCFTDACHTVNENSQQAVSETYLTVPEVRIAEEHVKTGGNYRCEGFKMTCPANETTTKIVSWKTERSIISSNYIGKKEWEGCVVNAIVSPETIVGIITADIASDVSVIPVSLTVMQNTQVGFELFINSDLIGEVYAMDYENNTVTLDTNTTTSYTAYSYVKIQTRSIKNYEIPATNQLHSFGVNTIGGSALPANTVVHVVFQNTTNAEIIFRFHVEYYY
jgi:hypothetical protein